MATSAQVSLQIFLSIPTVRFGFRQRKSDGPTPTGFIRSRASPSGDHNQNCNKWVIRSKMVDQNPGLKSTVDVDRLVEFLYEDLHHVFDEQGLDPTAYDEEVRFRDPITKHDGIKGYLRNIALLRDLFSPEIIVHWVKKVPSNSFILYICFHIYILV